MEFAYPVGVVLNLIMRSLESYSVAICNICKRIKIANGLISIAYRACYNIIGCFNMLSELRQT